MRWIPLLLALLGCSTPLTPSFAPPGPPERPTDGDEPDDDDAGDEPDDDDAGDEPEGLELTCPAAPHVAGVRLLPALTGGPDCGETMACVEPYLALMEHPEVLAEVEPRADCAAEVAEWYAHTAQGKEMGWPDLQPRPGETLGEAILDETQTAWLFEPERLWSRPLAVHLLDDRVRTSGTGASYRERYLILADPLVGQIEVRHLFPLGASAPLPTVLILPGHAEDAGMHRDRRFGQYLPEHGLGALIVSFRAWYQPFDHRATEAVLCGGMSMMMIRAYEAMTALRYLLVADESCGQLLGILGHSGGSLTGNLMAHLDVNPAVAFVSDLEGIYEGVDDFDDPEIRTGMTIDCETHPALFGLSDEINDLESSGRAVARVPYGYVPPGEPDDGEPDPADLRALDWFVPFFVEELGIVVAR
jgi:hypothetical protein